MLRAQGNLEDALEAYRASLAIRDTLARRDPANAGWQPSIVSTAANTINVRLCNNSGANASPANFTMGYMIVQ